MTEPRPRRGSLYLVPVALGEHTPWAHFLPAQAQAIAAGLRHFVVETARAARAHLKQLDYPHPLRETDIRELPAEAADAVLDTLLAPALAGADLGLLSDAGCPAVADPGARLVARAHARERGCCKLTLEVLSGNTRALRSYDRFGFAPYVLDPREGQALLMQKWL